MARVTETANSVTVWVIWPDYFEPPGRVCGAVAMLSKDDGVLSIDGHPLKPHQLRRFGAKCIELAYNAKGELK